MQPPDTPPAAPADAASHPTLARELLVPLCAVLVGSVVAATAAALTFGPLVAGAASAAIAVAAIIAARIVIARATHQLRVATLAAKLLMEGRYSQRMDTDEDGWTDEAATMARLHRRTRDQLHEIDSRDRRFLMSISHELRTPLTAIAGHAQALQEGVALDDAHRDRSLSVIRNETERLERLVGDVIDLARLRSNRFSTSVEEVDLSQLGGHLIAIFAGSASEGGPQVSGSLEPVRILSDGERILQILRNLVGNALRYADSRIEIAGGREQAHVLISVENDGEPINPDIRERMFEPFVGTKREGGMGLGLAISRELAWALGGELRLSPAEEVTRFELVLPLEPPGSGR